MRVSFTATCGFLAVAGFFAGSTSTGFRARYGEPIPEAYRIRPAVVATVTDGKSGQACEVIVAPDQSDFSIKSRNDKLDSKQMTEILEEIAPVKERGTMRMSETANILCPPAGDCLGGFEDWDSVNIYRNGDTNNEH